MGKVESSGTRTFRRDGADVTDDVLSDGAAVYTPGVSQRRSGTTTYDLSGRLGTATMQTNASTSITGSRTYDAFGMPVASTGTPRGPFGFVGREGYQEDADSGLKLLGHRYYDPSTGRFLTRDAAQDGRNWYAYCDGNPTAYVDPDGFQATQTTTGSVSFPLGGGVTLSGSYSESSNGSHTLTIGLVFGGPKPVHKPKPKPGEIVIFTPPSTYTVIKPGGRPVGIGPLPPGSQITYGEGVDPVDPTIFKPAPSPPYPPGWILITPPPKPPKKKS